MGRWRTPFPHVAVSEAELAACPVPVLLLWGDEDRVQPPDAGRRAAALLPAGRIEVLPGGHGLWFEQPGRCGELLGSFLQDVDH
jgi:pimeloyl-ACP methyl ester carboxylesterase